MGAIISKLFTFAIWVCHPRLPSKQRWFLRLHYKCRIRQLFFLNNDYIAKKRYKVISFDGEFAPELKFVLPFAYWHYLNGTLKETHSALDTKHLYYFSPNHHEDVSIRRWNDFDYDFDIPNSFDHGRRFDYQKWERVPLKENYKSTSISFERPTLVISNKYNEEWGDQPVNFLTIDMLATLFEVLSNKYQVVYNRPLPAHIVNDNSAILDLPDYKLAKEFPSIHHASELFKQYDEPSYNRFQLRVYAGCTRFISVQGGNSVLASYFGGDNVIFARKGLEIEMKEYETIYPKLSGARIHHVSTYDQLLKKVDGLFL